MLVNYGLPFSALETGEARHVYWQNEMKRLKRFIKRNKTFVEYYESGSAQHDQKYFAEMEADVHTNSQRLGVDGGFISTHDHLVSFLLAEQKYHKFAKRKLSD